MKNLAEVLAKIMLGGIVLCLSAIIFFSCIDKPLSPVAPMSDISLEGISLVNITNYLSKVRGKDIIINTDGTMSYIPTQPMEPKRIDTMKVQPDSSVQQVGLGPFRIVSTFSISQNISASSLSLSGSTIVPNMPLNTSPLSIIDPTFDYISLSSGSVMLRIINNMPVPIDFPQPIVLRNNWSTPLDTTTIAVFSITGQLNPGQSTNLPAVNIGGKLLRGNLKTDAIQLHTNGSGTSQVTFTSSSGISFTFADTALVADSALVILPNTPIFSSDSSEFTVDDSVVVQDADFNSGTFQIALVNNLDVNAHAQLKINNIIKIDNDNPYSIDTIISAKQTCNIPMNINNYRIQTGTSLSQKGTRLKYSVGITAINSGGLKRTVTKNDFVKGFIIPEAPLVIHSITGKIKPQTILINSTMKSGIDYKDIESLKVDSIKVRGVQLALRFPMTGGDQGTTGVPMDYHLTVIAKSKGVVIDSMEMGTDIGAQRIYPNNPVITISNAPSFDNFLSNFFPQVPDFFVVRGYLVLNPKDEFDKPGMYTIDDTSTVYPAIDVNFPFAGGIENGRITDVVGLSKDEIPKDFTKSVSQGTITFILYNHIPLNMAFRARFLGNYNPVTPQGVTLLTIPKPPDSTYIIQASPVVMINGFQNASGQTVSQFSVSLNGAEMELFNMADSLFVQFDVETSNHGDVIKVKDTDYIRVYAKGNLTYTMNKP